MFKFGREAAMDAIQSGKRRRISLKSDMDNLTATFEPDELVQKNIRETENSRDGNQTWAHAALASVPFVLVLGNSMIVPILPTLERQLGISNFQTSLVVTLFSVTAALVIPLAGYLSDRFSRKHVIVPALLIYGGAGILSGLAAFWQSYSWLIVFRAIQGIGAAGTTPIALALVGDMYKGAQESKALDLIEASNGFGKVVSPIFGSLLALLVWFALFLRCPSVV
jgi:ACDE family multidrug resistance protein